MSMENTPSNNDAQFLTTREVAGILRVSRQTLADWRHRGAGPKYYKMPGVRYKLRDILEWQDRVLVVPAGIERSSLVSS